MVCAAMNAMSGPKQIVFSGERSSSLVRAVHKRFLPGYVLLHADPGLLPKTAGMTEPGVYVCRDFACQLPVTTVEALNGLLK
jgi:uncharacterized protein YyaL (SSP411 family)